MWDASARYGYLFGGLAGYGNLMQLGSNALQAPAILAELMESAWSTLLHEASYEDPEALRNRMAKVATDLLFQNRTKILLPTPPVAHQTDFKPDHVLSMIARRSVDAFFDNHLLEASKQLLAGAVGSFGLTISHSLDCDREMLVAARGLCMRAPRCGTDVFACRAQLLESLLL